MTLAPCSRFGDYEVVSRLGAGGMGEVYRARDPRLEREVALKVLPAIAVSDDTARARLEREARMASRLNHPNVCTIYEVGEAEGQAYIAMELVAGQSLADRLAAGRLPMEQVVRLGEQMADALSHAHEHGVVHRDFKAANVIVTPEGRAKVLDFGLAKQLLGKDLEAATTLTRASLTEAGAIVGTLAYMAPEQLRGKPADARSDVWALGVVLYEMAAGRRPFGGDTGFELSSAILNQAPKALPAGVPPSLGSIIERCLAKEPLQRYQRAGEVRSALEAMQQGSTPAPWPGWRASLVAHRRAVAMAVVSGLLVAAAALDVGGVRSRVLDGDAAPRMTSLAVLPLENLSGDPEQDYVAAGVHEALIAGLAELSGLDRVIARTSVLRFAGSAASPREIAKQLDVGALVTGAVQRSGDHVRVTAHLINPASEAELWAGSFDRPLRDVLALQDEIVAAITREVGLKLTAHEKSRLTEAMPVDPEAYEAYLKGRFYLNKATAEGFEKGLAQLEEAVARAPDNPLFHAALALGYTLVGHARYPDAFARARAAARKAQELGGKPIAESYAAVGLVELYSDWDYAAAAKDLRSAIEINPNLTDARETYSWYLFLSGPSPEAERELRRAQAIDPLNPLFHADLAWQFWSSGRVEDAIVEAREALDLDPAFPLALYVLGAVHADRGAFADAIAAHGRAAAADPAWGLSLARTLALAGRQKDARTMLTASFSSTPEPTGSWAGWFVAEAYAALGESDQAFRWLEACYRERHSWMPWMTQNPAFAPLRNDPRFLDLAKRVRPAPL